jgi:ribonucleoside-triphosphate reductase (thioredoxin)
LRLVTRPVSNAISFTVNVPEGYDPDDLKITLLRWLPHLKGTTVMVDGSRSQAPFERISRQTYEMAAAPAVGQAMDECTTGPCPVR